MKKRVLIVAISSLMLVGTSWGAPGQNGGGNGHGGQGQNPTPPPAPQPPPQPAPPRQIGNPRQGTPRSTGNGNGNSGPRNTGANNGNRNGNNYPYGPNTFFWPYGYGYPWAQSGGTYVGDDSSETPPTGSGASAPAAPPANTDPGNLPAVSAPPASTSADSSPFPSASKAPPTTAPSVDSAVATPLKSDPAVVAAVKELDAASARLKSSLAKRKDYKAAVAAKEAAQAQAAALRASGDGSSDELMAAAQRGLDAGQTMATIEREAIARDPDAIVAKAHLSAAIAAHNAAQGMIATPAK